MTVDFSSASLQLHSYFACESIAHMITIFMTENLYLI